jgi:hypothetical protein
MWPSFVATIRRHANSLTVNLQAIEGDNDPTGSAVADIL